MINNEEKIKELEEKIEMLTKERDYYQKMYLECNDMFLQRIKIKPKTSAMLDEESQQYIAAGGGVISLTELQTRLLSILIRNKGRIVTYNEFEKEIYNEELEDHSAIRHCMNRLATKMKGTLNIKLRTGKGYYI